MENSIIFGFVLSIISGVIGNIVSNKLDKNNKLDFDMEPKPMAKKVSQNFNDEEAEITREENRKFVSETFTNFMFYVSSYIMVGLAFYLPMIIFIGAFGTDIDFNKTKLAIDIILNKNDFILLSSICALILYIPILFISKKGTLLISLFLTNFWKITNSKMIALRILIIVFLSIFLLANVYYALKLDILWWDSIKYTFSIVFFLFAFGINNP